MKRIIIALSLVLFPSLAAAASDEEARAYGEYLAGECAICHSRNPKKGSGSGIPPFVDISGWENDFFVEAMKSFTNGSRDNQAMVSVVNALDAEQLNALAVYFGSLKPAGDGVDAKLLEPFKWSPEILKLASSGDAAKGKALANDSGCAGCHGEAGVSADPNMPNLAGQIASYSLKQLYDFKQGARKSIFMAAPVNGLSLAQMADLAAFYASQKTAGAAKAGAAKTLALTGDKPRLLIGCDVCHGKDGAGGKNQTPMIGGQQRDYFKTALLAFKTGKRTNDHYARMRFIAGLLSKQEIDALAGYYEQAAAATGAAAAPSPAMAAAIASQDGGKKAYGRCIACHTIKKGGRNKSGPNLFGIVGAAAGKVAKYRYSGGLRQKAAAGLIWTEANLDAWLKNPRKFIGGRTKMSVRTTDAKTRAAVIGYMKRFTTAAGPK